MNDDGNGSGDFVRITNRMVWEKLLELEDKVDGIDRRQDAILIENTNLRQTVSDNSTAIEKLQTRFNGVLIGIGTGIAVGLVAFLRGMTG